MSVMANIFLITNRTPTRVTLMQLERSSVNLRQPVQIASIIKEMFQRFNFEMDKRCRKFVNSRILFYRYHEMSTYVEALSEHKKCNG
jgi:hypothetical protein